MKKLSLCLALFCMAVPSFAQVGGSAPKVAVYVAGGALETGELLRTLVLERLVNSGKYSAVERSEEFLKQLQNEHYKQRSGDVDDAQISRLGKQAGVNFVCVVAATPGLGEYLLSARIIDVETAMVVRIGSTSSPLKNMDDMKNAANEIVGKILGDAERLTEDKSSEKRQQITSPVTSQPPVAQPNDSQQQQPNFQQDNFTKGTAILFIKTQPPHAKIYIGGKLVGSSNRAAIRVPVGTHQMTLAKGGIETTHTMTFKPGLNRHKLVLFNDENFTVEQRFKTAGLNIIPGLGSAIIMSDWNGVCITWGLISGGVMTMVYGEEGASIGTIIMGSGLIFNLLIRPLTYNKPVPKTSADNANPYGDVKFAVLPDRNGDFKAVVAYELSF
jgi:hypothetical protein